MNRAARNLSARSTSSDLPRLHDVMARSKFSFSGQALMVMVPPVRQARHKPSLAVWAHFEKVRPIGGRILLNDGAVIVRHAAPFRLDASGMCPLTLIANDIQDGFFVIA